MREIILMRHGKPHLAPSGWLAPHALAAWITQYDASEVHLTAIPPKAVAAARNAALILTSTLPRAVSSAAALGHSTPRSDALFREAALPHALWRFPRLPPPIWAAVFRLLWLCGYARGADPLIIVRARAREAAAQLIACAAQGPVLLIGHGVMNRLIASELVAAGWIADDTHRSGYWATVRFRTPVPASAHSDGPR